MSVLNSDVAIIFALVAAAMVLLVMEIFTPSFGLLTLAAIVAGGIAVYMTFRINVFYGWELLAGLILFTPAYIIFLVKVAPQTGIGRRLFLPIGPSADKDATPQAAELESLVGMEGKALTILRPVGVVRVGGRRIDARSESDFIEPGTKIKVVSATGVDVVVRKCDEI